MLSKRIIPCLDVTNGKVVKGINFINLIDAGDPVELAKFYDQEGADELVFLDITASSDKRYILRDLVERAAEQVFIPFTVGGGINDCETIRDLLNAGADKVSLNTAAVKNSAFISKSSKMFGSQCIVLAIDAKKRQTKIVDSLPGLPKEIALDEKSKWEVFIHGGRTTTGIDAVKWAKFGTHLGAGEILLTSMDRDGTKDGYDLDLLSVINQEVKVPVIASGGAGTLEHILEALKIVDAALLASLLHFKELSIKEIKDFLKKNNIEIRG
ncbi:MAG: imidazole glycerol phosphate synthase subunit HisF [Candidatus Margulisiibacteriota bacterium]|jgi:cyclase